MDFVKLDLDESFGNYSYLDASNIAMNILGNFLTDDVGCDNWALPSYQEWALDDSLGMATSGNITSLSKEGNYIFLEDQCSEEVDPTELKLSRQQFVKLLHEWDKKVCKLKPKEVTITCINDVFNIETLG